MDKKRILIIDDETDFCKLVKKNLELSDFEVDIATNGKKGIALAQKLIPNLVLLDINMLGLDGFEVLKRLKEDYNTMAIPVVMLSARADERSKEKATQLYDEAYITKPINAPDLIAKIEEVLQRVNK